jgi:hypothetical protein
MKGWYKKMVIAALTWIVFIALFITAIVVTIRCQIRADRGRIHRREQERRFALELDPTYRAKVEEDRRYHLAQDRQAAELALQREELELRRYLAVTRATPETYLLDYEPRSITVLPNLRRVTEEKTNPYDQSLKASMQPPTEEFLLSQIKQNSCTVSPGIRASNGEPVLVDITQVPHGKLIGSSGFGKSTCMYIMLKQAAETNSPHRLQLCLLDLEHKTSRLLEDYPQYC